MSILGVFDLVIHYAVLLLVRVSGESGSSIGPIGKWVGDHGTVSKLVVG